MALASASATRRMPAAAEPTACTGQTRARRASAATPRPHSRMLRKCNAKPPQPSHPLAPHTTTQAHSHNARGCCRRHSREPQASSKTTYRVVTATREMVRIVWIHHPLYARSVRLVDLWRDWRGPWAVIELPDGSHTRVAACWVDDGKTPLPPQAEVGTQRQLSVAAVRELVEVLAQLQQRVRS